MPKKTPENSVIHPFALDKISMWGKAISAQRKLRRITMRDFAQRANISLNTLQRIERGEHSVMAGNYLNAMCVLGILGKLCITPEHSMMVSYVERVRVVRGDPDYF
ncbi:MAG: transcriptional regulator [Methylotenera sp.]|nr:MAG: transcriptional regulator [Methylotenera sp.]PPD18644.1 MAG: transcriptional regulator [Methylotenera sp.]